MPDQQLFTYKDATDHGLDYLAGAGTGADAKAVRRAAHDALRDLANLCDWNFYLAPLRVTTVATYATGTIAYDHADGANERMVTLTTGTWPDWAAYGVLLIGSVRYTVASRVSNSVVTLAADSNPGADVASGTSYTLYRDSYPVPVDFKRIHTPLWDCASKRELTYQDPREVIRSTRYLSATNEPWAFTIQGDSNYQSGKAFVFASAPSSARNYDGLYYRNPRPLWFEEESAGTVSVTADSATVTGVGTAFTSQMVGSVFRISSTADAPTGRYGSNPYAEERVVTARASDTSITVDAAFTQTLSGKKYVVSDPIDVDLSAMLNAYKAGIEAQLAMRRSKDDRALVLAAYQDAVRVARSADVTNGAPRSAAGDIPLSWQQARLRYGSLG